MDGRTKDIAGSLIWLVFALYVAFESYRIGLGQWSMPGPGYFPFGAALAIGILSLALLYETLRKPPGKEERPAASMGRLDHVVLSLFAMVTYVLLLKSIGFLICTFFLVLFFLRAVAAQRWRTALIVAFSLSLGFYLFFNLLLDAQLPNGIIDFPGV